MAWYWQLWLLAAFAIIAVVWKLVWLIIRDQTQYIYLKILDTSTKKPLAGISLYVSKAYLGELNHIAMRSNIKQAVRDYELIKIGVTDESGSIKYKNRWYNVQQIVIPERDRVFRFNEKHFQHRVFGPEPVILEV